MQTVCAHARRLIDIRLHGSIEVSTDEFLLCRAIHGAGVSQSLARTVLMELLDRQGAFEAVADCERLAADLASAGLDTSPELVRIIPPSAPVAPEVAVITRLRTGS